MLSRRQVQRGGNRDPVAVSITRADIGDFLGLTTETVSLFFTQLKRKGVIAILPGGRVELSFDRVGVTCRLVVPIGLDRDE